METQVKQFNLSISWIFESFKIAQNNPNTTVSEAFSKYIKEDRTILINHGLLLAACYMYFLLPKEKKVEDINIDSKLFKTSYTKKNIARRLRNSIAHGRIKIEENGDIVFEDNNKQKTDPFEVKISPLNLSKLIEEVGKEYVNG